MDVLLPRTDGGVAAQAVLAAGLLLVARSELSSGSMERPQASPTRIPDPMERDRERQLIVIGGGPGGMAAARAAARAGVRPLLVQMGPIGGDCTFTGCVPSKTLIEAAARGERFTEAIAATHRAVEAIAAQEDDDVVRGEGIDVLHGWATFRSPREVELDGTVLRSERVVIATGAGPAVPPIPGLADIDYLTNESIFELDQQPATLAVLGGGAVGCELAQAAVSAARSPSSRRSTGSSPRRNRKPRRSSPTPSPPRGSTCGSAGRSCASNPAKARPSPGCTSKAARSSGPTGSSSPSAAVPPPVGSASMPPASPPRAGS